MSDGFRNTPPLGSVVVEGTGLNVVNSVPMNVLTPDISNFTALELGIYATGSAGGTAGLLQFQLLWYNYSNAIVWVDTIEVNFDTVSGYAGKQAFVITPVRGPYLQIISDNGTTPPTNPVVTVAVSGLTEFVDRFVCWQDAETYRASDLIIIGKSGGAIASGGSAGPFNSGLSSGPVFVTFTVAFTTGAAVAGKARLRTTFGSSGVGWPDLVIDQGGVVNALGISSFFSGFVPRRPVVFTVADIAGGAHDTINSWQFSAIRAEP